MSWPIVFSGRDYLGGELFVHRGLRPEGEVALFYGNQFLVANSVRLLES